MIQKIEKYAIVVPCYNEEKRLPIENFLSFAKANENVILCFVNDGSKDNTLNVLRNLKSESNGNIWVYDLPINKGKSEAVRQGMLHVFQKSEVGLIGFLDADLATTAEEWLQMAVYKEQYPQFGAIVGSRIQRLGAAISRDNNRSVLSGIIKACIKILLKTKFQDTQCGAKIFNRNIVPFLFNRSFYTPWLFDVEIFLRLQEKFGKTALAKGVIEFPLMSWTEIGDSKLKFKDSIKIPMQLLNLYYQYHFSKKFITKSGYSFFDKRNNMRQLLMLNTKIKAIFI